MQVSVETLNGLERKITIAVPSEKVEQEVNLRLKNLARKVKIDGYRPGKVPFDQVKKRFSGSVRQDVAKELVQSTLFDALKQQELNIASTPDVNPEPLVPGKDFCYSAIFEVFPEIEISELNQAEVELVRAAVTDADLDNMIEKLADKNKTWHTVSRAAALGDKVVIDFEGFLGDEAFEGNSAKDYEIVLGAGTMIDGFESGLIGCEKGKDYELPVTFPENYGHAELAGKAARFKVQVHDVMEGTKPVLDDDFAKLFNISEGGMEALRTSLKENMVRELERRVSTMNREKIFDKLLEKNIFDLPVALVEQEIANLKHEFYHQVFGDAHHDNEKIPDFPSNLFIERAKRRVHLGLLFSEYVKKHNIDVDNTLVDAMIEKLAVAYENPDELRHEYRTNKKHLGEIQALVLEEMVADKILLDAKVIEKIMDYDAVMTPKKDAVA